MGQQQTQGYDRDERYQPEHNAAAGGQFLGHIEDMLQRGDGSQLRTPAHARQLQHRPQHARTHEQKDLHQPDVEWILSKDVRGLMIGQRDFMVSDRDDPPHSDRNHDQEEQRNRTVNRIQALAEFTDFQRYPMAQAGAPMRETMLHPVGQGFPFATHQNSPEGQGHHQAKKQKAAIAKTGVILRVRKRPSRTRQKDPDRHQDGKGPNVKYSLDRPDGNLGGNRQVLPPRNQIRTNEFSRTSQQRQSSESNEGGRHQLQPGCVRAHRPQEQLPTDRPKNIRDIYKNDGVGNVPGSDLLGLSPESSPVEASPMPELEIDQQTEDNQDSAGDQNAFSIHVRGGPERPSTALDSR